MHKNVAFFELPLVISAHVALIRARIDEFALGGLLFDSGFRVAFFSPSKESCEIPCSLCRPKKVPC
jgi:hypothetical protein